MISLAPIIPNPEGYSLLLFLKDIIQFPINVLLASLFGHVSKDGIL